MLNRVATFPRNSLPAPHRHHQNANKYQHLPPTVAHYRQFYGHLHYLHYKPNSPLQAHYRQSRVLYHWLPPVMKKYRHAGSVVVKLCTSNTNNKTSHCFENKPLSVYLCDCKSMWRSSEHHDFFALQQGCSNISSCGCPSTSNGGQKADQIRGEIHICKNLDGTLGVFHLPSTHNFFFGEAPV